MDRMRKDIDSGNNGAPHYSTYGILGYSEAFTQNLYIVYCSIHLKNRTC